ncbi:MAG: Adenylate cyclase [uncultured Solirubrobacteraceae bacterium]|uniref:Adenylate cyclase n=1 Tax=uncultured Solirubrobacteraceae bacterium TaxID=1162706 RepID=A0A6J4TCA0_9ACTN|nr:MAG: Adenylate cyclase [uncultured Solirubrobacteraceae bacterium]
MPERSPSAAQVAREIGTTAATLRRWVARGLIPQYDGRWAPAAIAHARLVARMRERGHSLEQIRAAGDSGRLAFGYLQGLFPSGEPTHTLEEAVADTGLEAALIERILSTLGLPAGAVDRISESEIELLRYSAAVLVAGLPLIAFLQLVRVYGQALAQMADAEVRLFHMYVHEPLMREGVPGVQMAEEMQDLAARLLPLTSPMMDLVHRRLLAHFVDQDVIGHMEAELDPRDRLALGHLRVAVAFADLAGYTRLTEELGDDQAVDIVERFVSNVANTLPDDARIVKTIGDEVMVVGTDAGALVDWAVGFQALHTTRPLPRIGMHFGEVLYRDGDYYGREVNQASRVSARSGAGEVLVTRDVVEAAGSHLDFELIGDVRLKGFSGATELFLARAKED